MDDKDVLLSVFVAVEGAHAFSAFNPSIFTIRRFPDGQTLRDIRTGCLYASAFTLIIGGLTSAMIGNWLPFGMAVLTAAGMTAVYEINARRGVEGVT